MIIKVIKGNNHDYIEQILPNLARTSLARSLLENLTLTKGAVYKGVKTIGIEGVEHLLVKELQVRKEDGLNQIRDEAKKITSELGYQKEFKKLNAIISALLATNSDDDALQSHYAKSVAKK